MASPLSGQLNGQKKSLKARNLGGETKPKLKIARKSASKASSKSSSKLSTRSAPKTAPKTATKSITKTALKSRSGSVEKKIFDAGAGLGLPGELAYNAQLARIVRVNHAGEFGAKRIYAGQLAVLKDPEIVRIISHMAAQEEAHLSAFEKEIVSRKVRPTALYPLWHIAGFALGALTARMGVKAAMACTVAVEEVIDAHYAQQLRLLDKWDVPELKAMIAQFRAEENEHEAIGRANGAEEAEGYMFLRFIVGAASRTAIWLSERI